MTEKERHSQTFTVRSCDRPLFTLRFFINFHTVNVMPTTLQTLNVYYKIIKKQTKFRKCMIKVVGERYFTA